MMFNNNKVYDWLKWTAQIAIPALIAFYVTIGDIWSFPLVKEISGTLAALDTLLGVVLGISSNQYHKAMENEEVKSDEE